MSNLTMKKADIVAAVIVIPICLYVFYESTKWPVQALLGRPFVIPRGVATFLLVAVSILLYRALAGRSLPLENPLKGAGPSPGDPGGRIHIRVFARCGANRVCRCDLLVHVVFCLGARRAALAASDSLRDPRPPRCLYALFHRLARAAPAGMDRDHPARSRFIVYLPVVVQWRFLNDQSRPAPPWLRHNPVRLQHRGARPWIVLRHHHRRHSRADGHHGDCSARSIYLRHDSHYGDRDAARNLHGRDLRRGDRLHPDQDAGNAGSRGHRIRRVSSGTEGDGRKGHRHGDDRLRHRRDLHRPLPDLLRPDPG